MNAKVGSTARGSDTAAMHVSRTFLRKISRMTTASAPPITMASRTLAIDAETNYAFANDTTAFIKLSIEEVVKTLLEAIILVVIVMFVFLQSWRATLVPAIAVPVVLLGTFAVFYVAGFSINTLTLFGLVLAIEIGRAHV